jgi:hypothetical protein
MIGRRPASFMAWKLLAAGGFLNLQVAIPA